MKKIAICIPLVAALLIACGGDRKAAEERLARAQALYERNEFFGAKNEIDSLKTLYPKEVNVLRRALTLMRQVELK